MTPEREQEIRNGSHYLPFYVAATHELLAEVDLLRQRIKELESTVDLMDEGRVG